MSNLAETMAAVLALKVMSLYSPSEQIRIATGEDFNPQYYIDYLKDKYTKLYDL